MIAEVHALQQPGVASPPPRAVRPPRATGARHIADSRQPRSTVPNAVIGMLVFLGAEAMFFAGLISAYLVLRAGSIAWPPPGQPRLPIGVTAINTLILLFSGYTMRRALDAIRNNKAPELRQWLLATAALGTVFLAVQGTEWIRLVRYGLEMTSGTYAATFYAVIGCHAVHVLGGVVVLFTVLRNALGGRYSARAYAGVEACRLYWFFVVGIWPVLYMLVYLL